MPRTFRITLFVLLCSLSAYSQSATEKTEYVIGFRITALESVGKGKFVLTLDQGTNVGLKSGERGEVWGILRPQAEKHNEKLGTATLKSVTQHEAKAEIETDKPVYQGHLIFLTAHLVPIANPTPYFRLVVYGITITNQLGTPYYTPEEVFKKDGFPFRTKQFLAMKSEINSVGSQLKEKGDTTTVEAGPNRGRKVWEVMQESDTLQVWFYVYHIWKMNDDTMGQDIKLGDGYFSYVHEGDAATLQILKDLFLDNAKEKWDVKFEQYKRKLPASWATGRKDEALELTKKGEYEEAHKLHDLSLFIARKYSDPAVLADCIFAEAETLLQEKKYNEAAEGYFKARDYCLMLKNDLVLARCDVKIGYSLKNAGRLDESLIVYKRAENLMLDVVKKDPQTENTAQLYRVNSGLADLYLSMKNYQASRATYTANFELGVKSQWVAAQAESAWGIAIGWDNDKKYAASIPFYEKSGKLYLADKDTTDAMDAMEGKGKALEKISEFNKAAQEFGDAARLAVGPNAWLMRAKLLKSQGRVLRRAGSFDQAVKVLETAQVVCAALGDKLSQSSVLREIAEVYADQKLFEQATQTQLSRLPFLQDQPITVRADVYWNIGYMCQETQKDYKAAILNYGKAVEMYAQTNDTTDRKTVMCNLALTYRLSNDSVNAYKINQQAIVLTAQSSDPDNWSYAYEKAAETYGYFKNYKMKIELLKKGLAGYEKLGNKLKCGEWSKSIADAYVTDLKDYKTANRFYSESINWYNQTDNPADKGSACWSYAYSLGQNQKDYKGAIANYKKSIGFYEQSTDTSSWKTVLSNLAGIYQITGDSVSAYKYHQAAIDLTIKNSDPNNLMFAYEKTAESYNHFKNQRKRIELLKKGLAYYESIGDHSKIGEWSKLLGKAYEEGLLDFKTADKYYLQAIEHYNQTNDLIVRGRTYWAYAYNIGQNEKRDDEAIGIYEIAYKLYIQGKDSSNASVVRSNVGQSYWSLNNFDKAIESHKEAIFLATRSGNQEQIFSSWNSLALLYKNTQNPVDGAEALKNAAIAVEKLSDSTLMATTYHDLAATYSRSKDYLKAIQFYEKALAIRTAKRDSSGVATTLGSLGGVYHSKNEYARAKEYYVKSIALRNKINDKLGSVYIMADLGNIIFAVDANYRKAEEYFMEAIQIAKDGKDDWALAFCYDRLGYLYRSEGKSEMAVKFKQMTEALYRKNKKWKDLAELTINKGFDAFYYNGDQNKGMQILDEAQKMQDSLKDKSVQAQIYNVRASILREMGEFEKALAFTDLSMNLYREVDNDWGILGAYVVKGNIYKQRGEYETALKYQFKADSMFHLFNNEYSRYVTFTNIGENYTAEGDYEKALEYYHKANAIFVKANDLNEDVASLQGLIGVSYFYENNFIEAEKWLNQSLVTCEKAGALRSKMENLSHLGRLNIAQKKYDEAFKHLSEGLKISKEKANKLNYLNNLVLMGKLEVERKNFANAKGPLEESVNTSKAIGKNSTLWESLYLLGILYKNTGDLPKSKEYLKEAVTVIEKLRNNVAGGADAQKLFSSNKNILNVYDALTEVLLALGETEEAMTYLQKNNEDNLRSKFKALDMKFESESKNKAVAEERDKKAKLDGIEAQIASEKLLASEKQSTEKLKNLEGIKTIAENEYLKFINQQINVQPELSKFFNNTVQPTQFRKIKKQIPKDMALISYLAGENQLYIFAATTDTVIAKIVTVSREQLTRDINAMLNIVRSSMGTFAGITMASEVAERKEIVMDMKQTDKSIKPFEDAYHYLIAPVSKEISGKTRLCIIPTGALNYIPFQLLGKTLSNGKFSLLMNQFAIFYANSTDMLFREKNDDDKKYRILAFGNPDKSLPSTEKEVNDIKRMYPSASIYLRDDATEDKAKYASENFNVMHFATHGNLDYEDFSKSYLTMAGNASKSEDGRLTLEELWGMEVMNHLNIVVLSACQTAVTKGSNESSPVSPASGFLQNGVKSVVATLWKVDDEATSMMMSDFYNNIKTMDAVDALRTSQTKLSTTTKFNHPYYWAAFVLLGDWR